MKPTVFFLPVKNCKGIEKLRADLHSLIKTSRLLEHIKKTSLVAVKLTFGEKSNRGYIHPKLVRVVVDKIKSAGAKPFLTDTNVIYHGQRRQAQEHLRVAYEHGFTWENVSCPLIIADGLVGENIVDVEINGKNIKRARIAGTAFHIEQLVSLAHFTGHMLTGFSSTIKNIGMGLASRPGKLQQHSNLKPKVIRKNCTLCGNCILICPAEAIIEKGRRAFILNELCVGCGDCLVACKSDAIEVSYAEDVEILGEKMVEYAYAVLLNIKRKVFFNFLIHITKECDCLAKDDPRIVPDIGILASTDPVAIDKAGIDLVFAETGGRDIFKHLHPQSCQATTQLRYAQKIGLGSLEYKLVCTEKVQTTEGLLRGNGFPLKV